MPRRPIQHVIDEKAETIFRDALPADWPRNPFTTDYAKDFSVEVFENEEATGEIFVVQLKGKLKLKARRDGKFVCRLDDDHLNYFHFKVSLPVFLVLVDTSTRDAFYAFVQGELSWIAGRKPGSKSGTIEVDPANQLKDTKRLLASIRDAWKYMRDKFPGSVEAAADFRRKELELLDPRFKYDVKHEKGNTHIVIHPATKPVEIKVHLEGKKDAVSKAWGKFLDFAEPLQASDKLQISVSGSPLFAEHGGMLKKLEYAPKVPSQVTITVANAEQRVTLPVASSSMFVARKRFRMSWEQPECPFSLELVVNVGDQSAGLPGKVNVECKWKPKLWRGKPLQMVPWLDSVNQFLLAANQPGAVIDFNISVFGNDVMSFSGGSSSMSEYLTDWSKHTEFLIRARRVDALLGLGLTIPKKWRRSHYHDMLELDTLVSSGKFEERGTMGISFALALKPNALEPDWNANTSFTSTPHAGVSYTIWGRKFRMIGAWFEFHGWESLEVTRDTKIAHAQNVRLVRARRTVVWTQCPWPRPPANGRSRSRK